LLSNGSKEEALRILSLAPVKGEGALLGFTLTVHPLVGLLPEHFSDIGRTNPYSYYFLGIMALTKGEQEKAIAFFDSSRSMFEGYDPEQFYDPFFKAYYFALLGVKYAFLGMSDEAIALGQRALAIHPYSADAREGSTIEERYAEILARVGMHDEAVDMLASLLERPTRISVPLLKIDPRWDPLRDHPRFQELLEGKRE